jgi:hypothetical protein
MQTTRNPRVGAALGRGFRDHAKQPPDRRWSRRWSDDRFLAGTVGDVRDVLSAPEPRPGA